VIKCQKNKKLKQMLQSLLKFDSIQTIFESMNSPKECQIKSKPQSKVQIQKIYQSMGGLWIKLDVMFGLKIKR
jgi:hypothetical protein